MKFTQEHEEIRRTMKKFIDPRDTRNVLGFALSICRDGDARTVRPMQFGVARP